MKQHILSAGCAIGRGVGLSMGTELFFYPFGQTLKLQQVVVRDVKYIALNEDLCVFQGDCWFGWITAANTGAARLTSASHH